MATEPKAADEAAKPPPVVQTAFWRSILMVKMARVAVGVKVETAEEGVLATAVAETAVAETAEEVAAPPAARLDTRLEAGAGERRKA